MRIKDIANAVAQHGARRYIEKRAGLGIALPMGVGYGLTIPSQVKNMERTYRDTRGRLDRAALEQLAPDVAHDKRAQLQYGQGSEMPSYQPEAVPKPYAYTFGQALTGSNAPVVGKQVPAAVWGSDMLGQGISNALGPLLQAPSRGLAARIERAFSGREFGEKKDPARLLGQAAISSFGSGMGQAGAELLKDIAQKAIASTANIGNKSARKAILEQLRAEDPIIADADDKMLMEAYHTMERFAPTLSTDKNAVRSFLRQAVMSGTGPDFMTIKLLAESETAIKGYKPGSKRVPWM